MLNHLFPIVLLAGSSAVGAQTFENVPNLPIRGFYYSAAAVADFNNDSFPDVFYTGAIDSDGDHNVDTTFNEVYYNVNGTYTEGIGIKKNVVHMSDVAALDFDNDGLTDIVTTGLSYNDIRNYMQYRYRNTGTGFELLNSLDGKIFGNLNTFDLNHDGRMDYTLNGIRYDGGFTYLTTLYLNQGNGFSENKSWMPGRQNGEFITADFDNDGEYEALIYGYDSDYNKHLSLYKNLGGQALIYQELTPLRDGSVAIADFNADGFQDFVIMGSEEDEDVIKYYINDGTGKFSAAQLIGEGLDHGHLRAADFNNDGHYDIAVIGTDSDYNGKVSVYNYSPDGNNFTEADNTGIYNLGGNGNIQAYDYNQDGKTDIMINGFDWNDEDFTPQTLLYKNTTGGENEKPKPPKNLSVENSSDKVWFSWDGASDDKTPANSLNYELSVGSQSGKSDIAKYVVTGRKWYLRKEALPAQYYWRIRSIDAAGRYSDSSSEQTNSTLGTLNSSETGLIIGPNPVHDLLTIKSGKKIKGITLYDLAGRQILSKKDNFQEINFSNLLKGAYILTIDFEDQSRTTKKIIKN